MTIAERPPTSLAAAATRWNAARLLTELAAIDAFNAKRRETELWAVGGNSREGRLDRSRRLDVIRREHHALVEATDRQLRDSDDFLRRSGAPRVVVVHRNDWFKSKVAAGLRDGGIRLVTELSNGADAIGLVVGEQPDLLLLEDKLPMVGGAEMVQDVRRYAPSTIVVVQLENDWEVGPYLDAGAHCAFGRRVPPGDVAAEIRRLLAG